MCSDPGPRTWRRIAVLFLITPLLMAVDCEEDDALLPSLVTGTVRGSVTIEGQGAQGVTVTLGGGRTTTTDASGSYAFDDVEEGSHVIGISGAPADVTFPSFSKVATIAFQGQTVTVDFSGIYIRTSGVTGTVTVDGRPLSGVTVTLMGEGASRTATTGDDGSYAFSGLRAGTYTVRPEGLGAAGECDPGSAQVTLATGEQRDADFACRITATVGISMSDADAEDGAVAGGSTIEVPVVGMKDGASATVGTARIMTGDAGGYFLDTGAGRFFADFPGFFIMDFSELPELFRLYTVFNVALALADGLSSTCVLDILGEDGEGNVINTFTLQAFQAVAVLQLAQAIRVMRMRMRATEPGACDGGFWAISGGRFPPPS